jgi:uncharacterized protein
MSESLPFFRYHPDPIKTGNIKASDKVCACCDKARGYIYTGPVYSVYELDESICPWCISDGGAAEKFDANFNDSSNLSIVSEDTIAEISKRTPGYESWQGNIWIYHCRDGCEFHGDLSNEEAKNLDNEAIRKFCLDNDLNEEDGREIIHYYEKGGNPAIYKFVCRHCGEIKLYTDCS